VHDAVGGVDVGGGDLRVVDGNALGADADGEGLALDGLDGLPVRQVLGVHAAGDDVVGEDVRTSSSCALFSGLGRLATTPAGSAANASLVGA
jgi:hypothetical protein